MSSATSSAPKDMHRLVERTSDHRPHVTERAGLGTGVHEVNAKLGIHDVSTERGALDQRGERRPARAQLLLGLLALGDVMEDGREPSLLGPVGGDFIRPTECR